MLLAFFEFWLGILQHCLSQRLDMMPQEVITCFFLPSSRLNFYFIRAVLGRKEFSRHWTHSQVILYTVLKGAESLALTTWGLTRLTVRRSLRPAAYPSARPQHPYLGPGCQQIFHGFFLAFLLKLNRDDT